MQKITTSISTFENIINSGYLYVDKTPYIYELVSEPIGQFFFSRPRRFGKSLTVSTLEAVFSGKKELFRGLQIYDTDYDWITYPIIHIDFGRSDSTTKSRLESWLTAELKEIAGSYDIEIRGDSSAILFGELIKTLFRKYGKGVVILIDEYDRPITNNIEDGRRANEIRLLMEAFYQIIKGYEAMERFVFLTGITRLSQVSVFSKLNNLQDISRNSRYSALVGYTQEELERCFADQLICAAEALKLSREELLSKLAFWYDGFRFTFSSEKLYNPVSIGLFLNENYAFRNYWYATATPVMLVNQARRQRLSVEDISNAVYTELSYSSFDIMSLTKDEINPQLLLQLLFQTGYLTFGDPVENINIEAYRLVYPNHEVQLSFEQELASIYAGKPVQEMNNVAVMIQQATGNGDIDRAIGILKALFAGIPYDIHLKYEKYYQSLMYLVFKMCGMEITAEDTTNVGRIDAVLRAGKYVYIIECKLNKTAEEAGVQIKDRKYYEKYMIDADRGKQIIAVGISFVYSDDIRNIDDYKTEVIEGDK